MYKNWSLMGNCDINSLFNMVGYMHRAREKRSKVSMYKAT